ARGAVRGREGDRARRARSDRLGDARPPRGDRPEAAVPAPAQELPRRHSDPPRPQVGESSCGGRTTRRPRREGGRGALADDRAVSGVLDRDEGSRRQRFLRFVSPLDPSRTVAELKGPRELTGNEDGAQRVAWTDTWVQAQEWMAGKLEGTGAEMAFAETRTQGWRRGGRSEKGRLIGGDLDSVPNGGWLEGALNVVPGAEVFRRIAEEGEPPVTVRLVSWADEEGACFGRSLFGSSAAAGSMRDQDELRELTDQDGISLPEALAENGVDLDRALEAHSQLESAAAYLELHIEQGPVLQPMGISPG